MKIILIILVTTVSLTHANTQAELNELNRKQRQAHGPPCSK
jgi:hypothetical protein